VIRVVHVVELPLTSVTVRISVLAPTSEQTNAVWLSQRCNRTIVAVELPLLTAAAVVEPFPVLSNCTVTFWQSAIGANVVFDGHVLAEQVLVLPFTSVTVRMTVFPLTFAQLKVVIFKRQRLQFRKRQIRTVIDLRSCDVALPVLSSCTVMFWQTATGATLSSTVIVVVQVVELPFTSVTVKTSVFAPTSEQTNAVWLKPTMQSHNCRSCRC
jgi:hypothetical protein